MSSTARRPLGHGPKPAPPDAPRPPVEVPRVTSAQADAGTAPLHRPGGQLDVAAYRECGVVGRPPTAAGGV
ncbi:MULTISPECIES: hypothetical protein [unclassified Streptomyces]|uniref:hypothetical protein n=1 Tax=unclassified Streptomyces TaxID=2593676 RepID=UPI00115FCBB6|nr:MULTISPECIES: hypothetical protein [unclassified Streptomyces]